MVYVVVFLVSCFPERKRVTAAWFSFRFTFLNLMYSLVVPRQKPGALPGLARVRLYVLTTMPCVVRVFARNDFPPRWWSTDGRVARADDPRGYVCVCVRVCACRVCVTARVRTRMYARAVACDPVVSATGRGVRACVFYNGRK